VTTDDPVFCFLADLDTQNNALTGKDVFYHARFKIVKRKDTNVQGNSTGILRCRLIISDSNLAVADDFVHNGSTSHHAEPEVKVLVIALRWVALNLGNC
jgi:hypothetical protein